MILLAAVLRSVAVLLPVPPSASPACYIRSRNVDRKYEQIVINTFFILLSKNVSDVVYVFLHILCVMERQIDDHFCTIHLLLSRHKTTNLSWIHALYLAGAR